MKITLGNLMDQLMVVNLKIWHLEDIKRDPDATDKEIAVATKKTNVLNQQRHDLIEAFDEGVNEIAGGKAQKLYGQGATKMYGNKK